jgi:hypothetical protein
MRIAATISAVLVASPALSDAFIDYGQLFLDKADRVTEHLGDDGVVTRELAIEPGINITQTTEPGTAAEYVAMDMSEGGAVGCLLMVQVELRALLAGCPDSFPSVDPAGLDTQIAAVSRFVAENAYPPMPLAEVQRFIDRRLDAGPGLECPAAADVEPDLREMMVAMSGPEAELWVKESLEMPRLPVMNPCL